MSKNNAPAAQKDGGSGFLIPIFAAIALIITCAVYIVYKLAQTQASEKWADYDDCGWS